MDTFLALTVTGLVTGCLYALTASGLVVTYTTSGIFNFAHGAIGMLAAFSYWELTASQGMPGLPALLLTVLVISPLVGAVIERLLVRRLGTASLEVTLTVTVGLLLLLIGIANTIWDPATPHRVQAFFLGDEVTVAGVVLTAHQLVIVATATAVAISLWAFLHWSRTGVALRAVVDDRELAALTGASPTRVGQLGWALGAGLAGLAGVLLASQVSLDATTMTLLVVNGYAAAVLGRLTNLPLTFVGGLLLGLCQAWAVGYLTLDFISQIQPVIPMLFLFVALVLSPQARLRVAQTAPLRAPSVPGARRTLLATGSFLVVAALAAVAMPLSRMGDATHGMAVALILLSLVPLVGYGGMVSLSQLTFAGIGAVALAKVGGGPEGLLAAIAVPAAVGLLVALPTMRLRGLHLALATLAFGYAMDDAFFSNATVMTDSLGLPVPRPLGLDDPRGYFFLVCGAFAVCAFGVLALRRSTLGRRLVALGDSPAGCSTLGMRVRRTKLGVFAMSAGMAGLGGALLGGQQGAVGSADFGLLLSLTLLLLAVVWGVRTVSGVLIAALLLEAAPLLQDHISGVGSVVPLLVGLGAIGLGKHQNGIVGSVVAATRRRRAVPNLPQPRTEPPIREEVLTSAQS
ncbi:MAG: livH 4 [Frankiales bacterium]|nr:livH 4 [Frankiales bacterium]